MKNLILIAIFCLTFITARAESLRVVEVSAPDINCVFDPACRVAANDTSAEIALPTSGENFLQTRTFRGQKGSPAAGMYAYLYRIDLRRAVGIVNVPCITALTVNFGNVVKTLDFDGDDEKGDEVFVITRGGLGSIGLASAEKRGRNITFNFAEKVCAGGGRDQGESTFFFGLVANNSPRLIEVGFKGGNTSYKSEARVPREKDPLADEINPNPSAKPTSIEPPIPLGELEPLSALKTVGKVNPTIRKLAPQPCVDRGGVVTIYGWGFGQRQGTNLVELGGHGIGILLRVRTWSDTKITAVIPDNPRIQFGSWYYIGLQNQDRNWISNISKTISICHQLE
jgi:hypothetical protein